MDKQAFLTRLGELLACLPADKVAESKAFYAEAIADRMEDGMTEQEAVAALGSPGAVAEEILDGLPAVPRAVAKTKRKSSVLLWALAIVGSPIWLSLLAAFLAVALGVYATIWALASCIWILAAGLIIMFPMTLVTAFWGVSAGNVPFAIAQVGIGIACLGVGLACLGGAIAASRQLARLSRRWARAMASPFKKVSSEDAERHNPESGGGPNVSGGARTAQTAHSPAA